jgi:hypothetical protein
MFSLSPGFGKDESAFHRAGAGPNGDEAATQNLPDHRRRALQNLRALRPDIEKFQENGLASRLHVVGAWIQPISIVSWRAQPIRA